MPYDAMARRRHDDDRGDHVGEVIRAFTSLNGTQMNCSGGRMPWGSWISCEETVNGPDVGPDFTGTSERAADAAARLHLRGPRRWAVRSPADHKAGRFAHEAAAFDPNNGIAYMTEDNFGFPSGLYRYIPPSEPDGGPVRLEDGGRLQMLAVKGVAQRRPRRSPAAGARVRRHVGGHRRPGSDVPVHAGRQTAPTTNDTAVHHVGAPGLRPGRGRLLAARGRRYDNNVIYFCSTQGGGPAETGARADTVQGWGNGIGAGLGATTPKRSCCS